jgi:hypothetical protein
VYDDLEGAAYTLLFLLRGSASWYNRDVDEMLARRDKAISNSPVIKHLLDLVLLARDQRTPPPYEQLQEMVRLVLV